MIVTVEGIADARYPGHALCASAVDASDDGLANASNPPGPAGGWRDCWTGNRWSGFGIFPSGCSRLLGPSRKGT